MEKDRVKSCQECIHYGKKSCPLSEEAKKNFYGVCPDFERYYASEFDMRLTLNELNKKHVFRCPTDIKELLVYEEGVYVPAECRVHSFLEEKYGESIKAHDVEETIKHLQRANYVEREKINKFVDVIPIANGFFNLNTRELLPFDPSSIYTFKLNNVEYDEKAECPEWKDFLNITLRKEDVPFLQEIMGYCLLFAMPFHKLFWFYGQIGTGKSTLLEHVGIQHLKKGAAIIDLFGSADGEGLAWLRSPHVKDKRVCLLRGENVDVRTSHDVKTAEQLTLKNLETYDFIISSRPLYLNTDFEFYSIGKLTDLIYRRLSWNRLLYLIAREAGNLWFSRLKVSEKQTDAKSEAIYMLREMRHLGCALGLDSLRTLNIDIDIRSHSDIFLLKAQGIGGLSKDLSWLYGFFAPSIIRNMPPQYFVTVSRRGPIGLGHFPYHNWHKIEKENILKAVGVKVEYGEVTDMGIDRGTYKTVSDKEHVEIVTRYHEGESMNNLSRSMGRSTKTISDHVHGHENEVAKSGFCRVCKKLRSDLADKMLKRR